MMSELKIDFEDDEKLDRFVSWLSDAGGEQYFFSFLECHDLPCPIFDYKKVFPAWGYNPEKDGTPTLTLRYED